MRLSRCVVMMLTFVLLVPVGLWPQIMPPQPARLNIYSQPAGAVVTINGQRMQQRTNASFVVSPGNYQISVTNPNSKPTLNCPSKPISVSAGQTVVLNCTSGGWK